MPDPVLGACLARIHDRLRGLDTGEVATYIPELATVDADRFGLAVATLDGHVYAAGDADAAFTIQSVSQPFVYGMALDDHGVAHVSRRIGVEPSGEAFNAIVMDDEHNRPMNPMVNAGAIVASSMVRGDGLAERRGRVLDAFGRYAGRALSIDEAVAESERRTGHRNRAIAYLELSSGMIDEPVDEHLDLYFAQCSIEVTARDLAVMAATLANGGVNPVTGARALGEGHVAKVLSVMATCGMYDWSGNWMFRIGMPAKSGVGGGIIAVLPGQVGIGTFSPRLDEQGNSVRGIAACEALADELTLHVLDATATASPVVHRRVTAAQVSSRRRRRAGERAVLEASGPAVTVLVLQGDLFFATAEQLVRAVEGCAVDARVVVLDARRLGRATAGAVALLGELHDLAVATDTVLVLAGAPEPLVDALVADGRWPRSDVADDVDVALERGEDLVLAEAAAAVGVGAGPGAGLGLGPVDEHLDLGDVDVLRDLDAEDLAAITPLLVTEVHEAGEVILREGEPADRLCYLVAGSATVRIDVDGDAGTRTRRLRSFGPGTMFGEGAALDGGVRAISVVADERCVVRSLPTAALARLAAEHPAVHAHLLAALGRNLAELLHRAIDEVRALDE